MDGFDDLEIKESYDSEEDDVLNSFYIPVLKILLNITAWLDSSPLPP